MEFLSPEKFREAMAIIWRKEIIRFSRTKAIVWLLAHY